MTRTCSITLPTHGGSIRIDSSEAGAPTKPLVHQRALLATEQAISAASDYNASVNTGKLARVKRQNFGEGGGGIRGRIDLTG
eukprot:2634788-Prymnesium_polylepis.1